MRTLALRGAQGDHPTEGREAPEAKAAQPSHNGGIWKALEAYPVGVEGYESPAGSSGGRPKQHDKKASVPAGHTLLRKTTSLIPFRLPRRHMPTEHNTLLSKIPQFSRQFLLPIQRISAQWHCAARREITRPKGGKLPKRKPRSPRTMTEYGKPLKPIPWEC